MKNASTLHASKQRKGRISNWNLDTVSQSSENSKNENENDAIEEKWFQMKKYMQAKNWSRRSQGRTTAQHCMITFELSLNNIGKGSTNKHKERKTLNTHDNNL